MGRMVMDFFMYVCHRRPVARSRLAERPFADENATAEDLVPMDPTNYQDSTQVHSCSGQYMGTGSLNVHIPTEKHTSTIH